MDNNQPPQQNPQSPTQPSQQPPPPNTPNQPTTPPMPKKFPTKHLIIIGAIVLLLLLSTGAYAGYNSFFKPTPPSTPTPQEGEISWQQAVSLVNSCQVDMVFQTHDLKVTLTLKDGETVTTTEPAIDDIFDVVKEAEPTCGTIPIATE